MRMTAVGKPYAASLLVWTVAAFDRFPADSTRSYTASGSHAKAVDCISRLPSYMVRIAEAVTRINVSH